MSVANIQHSTQVSLYYLNQVAEVLRSHHVCVKHWLGNEGLTEKDLYDSRCLVDADTYCRLIVQANTLSRLPHLGLIVGAQLSINHHGALGFALLNCGSIKDMLRLFERYLITRTPLFGLNIERGTHTTCVTLHCAVQQSNVLVTLTEVLISAFISIVNSADSRIQSEHSVQRGIAPKAVKTIHFNYAQPVYVHKYKQLFECDLVFSKAATCVMLNNILVDKKLRAVDEYSLTQAKLFCEQELSSVLAHASWKSKVLMQVISVRDVLPDINSIAQTLNVSARTLHRHLEKEGTHFKAVADEAFCALAKRDLSTRTLTIKQVAYKLGYSDVANFRRAFKRWTGLSPQAYVNAEVKKPANN